MSEEFYVAHERANVSVTLVGAAFVMPMGTISVSIMFNKPGYWYLNRLFVRAEHRGKGYGRKLLERLWQAIKERREQHPEWSQIEKIVVEPGGYNSDPKELDRFYKHMGFEEAKGLGDQCLVKTL